jgi:hypothetical protein
MQVSLPVLAAIPAIIGNGNTKLGPGIYTWSLPAAMTCPGRSTLCERLCYALKGRFVMARQLRQAIRNWIIACTPFFVWWMVRQLTKVRARVVRIHVSGDFFSAVYVKQWARIAESLPQVRFFAYTRSWRVPAIRVALAEFSRLPNVELWYSEDSETGCPKLAKGERRVRLAYLATYPGDVPAYADLVFRDYPSRGSVQKRVDGVLVCPAENGISGHVRCSSCGICWSDPATDPAKDVSRRFSKAA